VAPLADELARLIGPFHGNARVSGPRPKVKVR
jgi:hypothetical protein